MGRKKSTKKEKKERQQDKVGFIHSLKLLGLTEVKKCKTW